MRLGILTVKVLRRAHSPAMKDCGRTRTHFDTGHGDSACGWGDLLTGDPFLVTCYRCKYTRELKDAERAELRKMSESAA
mgnify:CR=1 FL=1